MNADRRPLMIQSKPKDITLTLTLPDLERKALLIVANYLEVTLSQLILNHLAMLIHEASTDSDLGPARLELVSLIYQMEERNNND